MKTKYTYLFVLLLVLSFCNRTKAQIISQNFEGNAWTPTAYVIGTTGGANTTLTDGAPANVPAGGQVWEGYVGGAFSGTNDLWHRSDYQGAWATANDICGGAYQPPTCGANGTAHAAFFDNYDAPAGSYGVMQSPALNLSTYCSASLSFYYYNRDGQALDVEFWNGSSWVFAATLVTVGNAWVHEVIAVPASCLVNGALLAFVAVSNYGLYPIGVDEVILTGVGGGAANDNCATPTVLTSGVLLAGQTNACATTAASDPNPACAVFGDYNTVWYTITLAAASTLTVTVTDGTMTYAAVSVYTGACGSLAEIACSSPNTVGGNPSVITNCLPAGTYHIMVWDDAGTTGSFSILATATAGCVLNNNPCASAYAIPTANLDGTWNTGFTNVGASSDGSHDSYGYCCYNRNDWFSFVAQGPNIEISVTSANACMNPEITLFSNNPCGGAGTTIGVATSQACDPWGYPTNTMSLLNNVSTYAAPGYFTLTIGQTYWFSVTSNTSFGCTGTYSVNVNNPVDPDPPGTDCKTAQVLCAGGTYAGAANLWGTQELNYNGVYASPQCCNLNEEINSSWYVINILTGGTLTFTLQAVDGTDDYDYAMYKGATCTLGQPISCNYSAWPGITGINTANCTGGVTGSPCSRGVSTCANDGAPSGAPALATSCDGCSNFTNSWNYDAASTWNSTLNVATGDVYIFYVNGYTPSSGSYNFTFGGTAVLGCTLPVVLSISLLNFTATLNGNQVDLNWSTASETDNKYFTVERSSDGKNFEELTQVKGAGNSTEKRNYSAIDYMPLSGTSYYRLSQTDFYGVTNPLTIASVNNTANDGMFTVVPNPTSGIVNINYSCASATTGILNLYDGNGTLQLSKEITCVTGNNKTQLDLGDKASGIYLVTFTTNDKYYRTKLMKR